MQTQGTGGGYGDVLERDPELVVKDLREGLISDWVARNIYRVACDSESLALDTQETERLRAAERAARLERGVPVPEFVEAWNRPEPPDDVPYYGCWDDVDVVYGGSREVQMLDGQLNGVYIA